jgi:L-aminopeptidase/D-esterase-like protein
VAAGAITDVEGIAVGHWTDAQALTGCTAVVCREGAVAGVAVRGAAPGTRETDLCRPGTLIERVHAVMLCGGSAYGLEAASGAMRALRDLGAGYDARGHLVPIVPAAVIFDLALGEPSWPDVAAGRAAVEAAARGAVAEGAVGVGAGATVGKLRGMGFAMKGGVGTASVRGADAVAGALVVVNAGGDVVDPDSGAIVAGTRDDEGGFADSMALIRRGLPPPPAVEQTTLGVVAVDAPLSPEQAHHLASVAHDGLARTVRPVHTMHDGDTVFALAPAQGARAPTEKVSELCVLAVLAVEAAVLRAVRCAQAAGGLPAAGAATRSPGPSGDPEPAS